MTLCKKIALIALLLSILLTLTFIFSSSLKSPEVSVEESENVTDKIGSVVPPDTAFGAFLKTYLRKIAHFLEFVLLGAEISLIVIIYIKRLGVTVPLSLLFGTLTAVFDETLQVISKRGSSVIDVWIDVFGYTTATVLAFVIYFLLQKRKRKN